MKPAPPTRIGDLTLGQSARVVRYEKADPTYRARLLAMGLTKGVEVTLRKRAPLGDPVELEVRGYRLSLRRAEADVLVLDGSEAPEQVCCQADGPR